MAAAERKEEREHPNAYSFVLCASSCISWNCEHKNRYKKKKSVNPGYNQRERDLKVLGVLAA